jgi:DNA-binding NarL/FixJ family response regulator
MSNFTQILIIFTGELPSQIMIETIIVDDHALFRLGMQTALAAEGSDIHIAGEADSGEELFALLGSVAPDVVLLDIILPGMQGIEVARRLKAERPEIKILAVSAENSAATVQAMLDAGVEGFISKRRGAPGEIAAAIRSVAAGFEYFGSDIADIIYKIYVAKKHTAEVTGEFTAQERCIIELCREGLPSKLIADRLCVSPRTVENHQNNIFKKLGIGSTLEMVRYAIANGIICAY